MSKELNELIEAVDEALFNNSHWKKITGGYEDDAPGWFVRLDHALNDIKAEKLEKGEK